MFTIQETHFAKKGMWKIEGFEIFESIRKKSSGGSMIGVHQALSPILITEYCEDFELIVVEIRIGNEIIGIISGSGPKESWPEAERLPFFLALEQEIIKAEMEGASIMIEMDSNSKLGKEFISADPHSQSPNGRVLADIIVRHGLIVANGLDDKCKGYITRKRETKDSMEKSIIDHVIISEDLVEKLEYLLVDEEREHVLSRITKTKKGVIEKQSDHNVIVSKFKFNWKKKVRSKRIEMYNLKNQECQAKFK